jgi:protein-disulfide isomerase
MSIIFTIIGIAIGAIGNPNLLDSTGPTAILQQSDISSNSNESASTTTQENAQPTSDTASARQAVDTDGDPSIGPEDAPIIIVEFSDFQCSYCKQFHDQT